MSRQMQKHVVVSLVALVALPVSCVYAQTVLYVDQDAPGANNGSSWDNAFLELQSALAAAEADDEIRVAGGTYKPDRDAAHPGGTGSRTATFQLRNGVGLYGGYAGYGAPDPDARDIAAYPSILSGDIGGTGSSDNSYHVVTGSGTNATALLDGFSVTGGNANGSSPHHRGGGMYTSGGSPTLVNFTFSGNSSGYGGGISNGSSSPTLSNCILWGNTASFGAQIWGSATVTYSNVQSGWSGIGNINADPLFVSAAGGDLRLSPGSPCIDSGKNAVVPADTLDLDGDGNTTEPIPFDLDGNPRFVDDPDTPDCPQPGADCGPPPIVDMGAYEYLPDCNNNSIPDDQDIADGTSADYDLNGVPDECEPDCNTNGVPDACDVSCTVGNCASHPLGCGVSDDCQPNGIPDECEPDCNLNGVADGCDIAAGTSDDCQPDGVPDECEPDCNADGVADSCDIDLGTSQDCNSNAIPDECDLAAGTSGDCNANGWPDECDIGFLNAYLWNGFQGLAYQLPMHGVDLDGDGVAWINPADSAKIWLYGCEFAGASDRSVQVTVVTDPPEDGYLISEYFRSDGGELPSDRQSYTLSFRPRLEGYLNPKTDWQFFLYDAKRTLAVVEIDWISMVSLRVPAEQRGQMLVKNPAGASDYLPTGVATSLSHCWDLQVVLNNLDGTVQVYIDGLARLDPPIDVLEAGAGRLDYFRVQAVSNGASTGGTTALKLDAFDLGSGGTSPDANSNGVPDECEQPALLTAAVPADQSSLWRSANNTIRLTFGADITVPEPGQVRIQEMLPDGAFGPDLSTNGFSFAMENDGDGHPRALKIQENGPVLTHRTWIAVRNLGGIGGWTGVGVFEVQYVVQVGDVNGDGKVLANDLSAVFPRIPSNTVPKPSGH